MQSVAAMRDQLHHYLDDLDEKKVQALYDLFELDEIENERPAYSKEFFAEMNERVDSYLADRSTGLTPEESKRRAEKILAKYRPE